MGLEGKVTLKSCSPAGTRSTTGQQRVGQESPKHGKHPKGHKPREKEASSGEMAVGGKSGCVGAHMVRVYRHWTFQ